MPTYDNSVPVIVDPSGRPFERENDLTYSQQDIEIIFARERSARFAASASRQPFKFSVWVYAIVSDIATTVADIPFGMYKASGTDNGKRFGNQNWTPINDDPLLEKIQQPNSVQDGERFIAQWVSYLLTGGNVWIYRDLPNSKGLPRGLYLFGVDRVRPIRPNSYSAPSGWEVTGPDGLPFVVGVNDLIHTMLPNDLDQWMGIPPCFAIEMQLDADRARVMYDRYFFQNNATPEAVLTYKPGPLNRQNRQLLLESWYESHGGPDKAGGIAVIGGDYDLKVLGITHAQAQYLESRKFHAREVASIFHYPVQLLNETEGSGLSKDELTVARMMKYENAIFPVASMFARTITNKVIVPLRDRNAALYFDYDGLPVMVDFLNTKMDTLSKMVKSGIPLNQAVRKLDIGIKDTEGGDVGLVANNLVPMSQVEDITKKTLEAKLKPPTPPAGQIPQKAKTAPAGKKAPAKTTAKSKIRSGLSPAFVSAKRKCKRALFDMRNDAFAKSTSGGQIDHTKYLSKMVRGILPSCYISFWLGKQYAIDGRIRTPKDISIDKMLDFVQRNISMDNLENNIPQIKESAEKRIGSVLVDIASDIEFSEDKELVITRRFEGLYDIARIIAAREILDAFDVGFSSITGTRYFNSRRVEESYEKRT